MTNSTFQPTIGYATIHQTSLKNRLANDNFSVEAEMLGIFEDETALPTALFGLETDLPESLSPLMQNQGLKARYQSQRLDASLLALQEACTYITLALPLVPESQVPYSHKVLVGLKTRLVQIEAFSQKADEALAKTVGIQAITVWLKKWSKLHETCKATLSHLLKALPKRSSNQQQQQVALNQLKGIGLLVPYLSRLPHAQASLEAGVWVEVFKTVRQQRQTKLMKEKNQTA
jgi:hypothetical protein